MRLAFGSDHAGLLLRQSLEEFARGMGHQVTAFGAMSTDSYDYPDAANLVCAEVLSGRADIGALICGSGIGVSIRANRHKGIRAANCCSVEMAQLARQHNHANVLALGARLLTVDASRSILEAFLNTEADTAERHQRRVGKLDASEST